MRRTIVNQIRCCVPGSARLFLLKLEHLAPSCHLCRSHCLHYEHTMEHLTLQLDVMGTLAKQCNNVLPQLVAQLWILAVFLSDFMVTCVTTRSSRYLLRENTRRINSEKGQNYDVHYAPHISLIFTDVCFSHVYVLGLGKPLFEMCFHMGITRKCGE